MSHGPWMESTRRKVREFFVNNPDEELTYALLMDKFDLTRSYAAEIVKILKDEGLIECVFVIRNRNHGRQRQEERST